MAAETLRDGGPAADALPMITLVCRACGGVLVFGANGWEHRDAVRPCDRVVVAWPPPTDDPEDEPLSAAG